MLNAFDIAVLSGAGVLMVIGLMKGLVRILIGLAALVAAFGLAAWFHRPLAARLGWLDLPENVLVLIAYVAIVLGVMLAGATVAALIRGVLRAAMLGWVDRLGGALLGLVAATLIAALGVLPVVAYLPSGSSLLDRSLLAPYVAAVGDLAAPLVPDHVAQLYEEQVQAWRRAWQERGEQRSRSPQ